MTKNHKMIHTEEPRMGRGVALLRVIGVRGDRENGEVLKLVKPP